MKTLRLLAQTGEQPGNGVDPAVLWGETFLPEIMLF